MLTKKEKLIKRLSCLKQNISLTPEQIEKIADQRLETDGLQAAFSGLDDAEVNKAVALYQQYVEQHSFESLAEKSTLISMIYKEMLKISIQEFIKKEREEKSGAIPLHMTEKLMELDAQILSDKEKLGMLTDKATDSFASAWSELKQKAINYYQEHKGCNVVKCPNCQSLFMLLLKVNEFTPEICTFFKGTLLYNKPLLDLYHQKKITIEETAKILGVHPAYVNGIYTNIYLRELNNAS
jgi:hypothetical protein